MGDISVGQTKRIKVTVTGGDGTELTPAEFDVASSDDTIATTSETGDQTERDLTGTGAGSVTVTASGAGAHAGQTGSATFTVDAAGLTVELV